MPFLMAYNTGSASTTKPLERIWLGEKVSDHMHRKCSLFARETPLCCLGEHVRQAGGRASGQRRVFEGFLADREGGARAAGTETNTDGSQAQREYWIAPHFFIFRVARCLITADDILNDLPVPSSCWVYIGTNKCLDYMVVSISNFSRTAHRKLAPALMVTLPSFNHLTQ